MTTRQVETATVIGTVTLTGNATVTITSRDVTGSPLAISVAATSGDTASVVAGLIRTALAFNQYVAAQFIVSGAGANVVLTSHLARANDSTLNIAIANDTCTGLTAAPTSTNTTAGDGLLNAYCALLDVRNNDVVKLSDTTHDDLLCKVINAVSRKIDDYTGRRFYAASETRYYTAEDAYCLKVHEIGATTGITIETDVNGDGLYEYTWASTDYNLAPYNALSYDWVFTEIEVAPLSYYFFPTTRRGVKITAPFGWASIPEPVTIACILQSNLIWASFKVPLGVAGATAIGEIKMETPSLDPKVKDLLNQYRVRT